MNSFNDSRPAANTYLQRPETASS